MRALVNSMSPHYEFFFPTAPESGLWVQDPPGGKGEATTDPDIAAAAVAYLNKYVQTNGPFHGILGYSQGSMFAAYYVSVAPVGTFQIAMLFCGYLPTTHLGLLDSIEARSPFSNISVLVSMGADDFIITNEMTQAQAAKFTSPVVLTSATLGHELPTALDSTYSDVLSFVSTHHPGGNLTLVAGSPSAATTTKLSPFMLLGCMMLVAPHILR